MTLSPYVARLRAAIGTDLLLLPSVAVLPRDDAGRLLLVRQTDSGQWATIGGAVEPDEDPALAAAREAFEEVGVTVHLTGLLAALGGPRFRVVYPGGDVTSYVTVVFGAVVERGEPRPDGDETTEARWFSIQDLPVLDLTGHARATLEAVLAIG